MICKICKKFQYKKSNYSYKQWDKRIYCSSRCQSVGTKRFGANHSGWKGEDATYDTKHDWMERHYGKIQKCEAIDCDKSSKKFDWANISGKYKRERTDWKRLCRKCHKKMDYLSNSRGERNGNAKFNTFQIKRIKLMKEITPFMKYTSIATIFNVHPSTIRSIFTGRTWKHI